MGPTKMGKNRKIVNIDFFREKLIFLEKNQAIEKDMTRL